MKTASPQFLIVVLIVAAITATTASAVPWENEPIGKRQRLILEAVKTYEKECSGHPNSQGCAEKRKSIMNALDDFAGHIGEAKPQYQEALIDWVEWMHSRITKVNSP
jgi:hypothetical protein